MKLAPAKWSGSARQLINDILKPQFLPVEKVEAWHQFLSRRLGEADPTFVVGAPTPELRSRMDQEKISLTRHDSRILFGDRSPAVAITTYLAGVENTSAEKMAALYLHLPHHSFDLDKFTRWAGFTNNAASAGWMVASIFSGVKADSHWESLSSDQLKQMTVRNIHPLNFFLFPNLNKSGTVFADDPRFHSLMAEAYEKYYGPLWTSFLEMGHIDVSALPAPVDFEIDLSAQAKVPEGFKMDSKALITKIEAKEAFDLKLISITEAQGYLSRILEPQSLTRGVYDIKLELKDKEGAAKTVGYYRLNIKDLYEKNFLSRDAKGVRLLVYKGEGNHFSVGPKKSGPMTPFPE